MIIIDGNDVSFSVANTARIEDNILTNKTFFFLGSSVTYGSSSQGEAMPEFIAKRNGCICIKEAVSGTTLADNGEQSYVRRLEKYIDSGKIDHIDALICQLSTNDRLHVFSLGEVTADDVKDLNEFDKTTTFGAIEYIIALAKQTWNCPIVFYTNTYFSDSIPYELMIKNLKVIALKWDITILDLFWDKEFNDITPSQCKQYMADFIHPTRAGYREWWVPSFEDCLKNLL